MMMMMRLVRGDGSLSLSSSWSFVCVRTNGVVEHSFISNVWKYKGRLCSNFQASGIRIVITWSSIKGSSFFILPDDPFVMMMMGTVTSGALDFQLPTTQYNNGIRSSVECRKHARTRLFGIVFLLAFWFYCHLHWNIIGTISLDPDTKVNLDRGIQAITGGDGCIQLMTQWKNGSSKDFTTSAIWSCCLLTTHSLVVVATQTMARQTRASDDFRILAWWWWWSDEKNHPAQQNSICWMYHLSWPGSSCSWLQWIGNVVI